MTDEPLCTESVNRNGGNYRWTNFQPCGRKAVEDGLCKLHVNVRNKRKIADAAFVKKLEDSKLINIEADRLSKLLGFTVKAEYRSTGGWGGGAGYTGNFIVPGDWLKKVAEEENV